MSQFVDAASFVEHIFNYNKLNGYLFRGITDAEYRYTEPRAFREKFIKEIAKKFPHNENVIREWFSKAIKAVRENHNKVLAATPQILLERLCQLLIANIRYNHAIYDKYHHQQYPQNETDKKLIEIFKYGAEGHWATEAAFLNYYERFHMAMTPLVSEGKIIKPSFIMEDLTGLDETYPQHYDMPTSVIDWTFDPVIAIFFAVYTDKSISNTKYLSVTIFKEINKESSPIVISDKDSLKSNERATAQKGTFSYFRHPCSYFLATGFFPSIESYGAINKQYNLFEFEKFPLLRTKENLKYIKSLLEEHQINEEKLKLPPGEPWPF